MSDSRHFFIAFAPPTATKQEHKISAAGGKVRVFPSPAWQAAEADLIARLEPHRPNEPMRGPVILDVTWCFPRGAHADGEPHAQPPDTDNLDKGLKDVMTRLGWWKDDAQVFSENITKVWAELPGLRIDIEEVGQC